MPSRWARAGGTAALAALAALFSALSCVADPVATPAERKAEGSPEASAEVAEPASVSVEPSPADPFMAEPRATMHKVFEAMSHLLPLALDEQRFVHADTRPEIEQWLAVLRDAARDLETHAQSRDPDFRSLSRSLSADLEEVRYRYETGLSDQARYFLLESTRNCVSCHSRLPAAGQFPMAQALAARIDSDSLSPHQQATYAVATRRFEDALTVWEALFEDSSIPAAELDLGGYLLDYLTIAVRVVRDPPRASRALAKLRAREGLPERLEPLLERWQTDLDALGGVLLETPSFERARGLIEDGEDDGRRRLIPELIASAVLHRVIDTTAEGAPVLPGAFYWLGVAEMRSVGGFWMPRAESHLEMSIRLAPEAPHARDALRRLEEALVLGYGGSAGTHLPADEYARIEELRKLVESAGS